MTTPSNSEQWNDTVSRLTAELMEQTASAIRLPEVDTEAFTKATGAGEVRIPHPELRLPEVSGQLGRLTLPVTPRDPTAA